MKIPINLASQPFRRDRAMMVASTAVCGLLVVSLAVLISLAMQDNQQMADVRREVDMLRQQIQTVNGKQAKLDAVVRQPENETVLERSVFINSLLLRKGISWNQIFTDLEKTIPYNVKLTRIRPSINDQGKVMLDINLASETTAGLVNALKAFKDDAKYGSVDWKSINHPTQTDPLERLILTVTYAQKL